MSAFIHRFEPATRPDTRPLLLLHGTGGDENDLIPLGRAVAPGAALLSPRGQVLEHGMPRFFRRLAEGVFDEEDVRRRAHDLADFINDSRARYRIAAPIALGYSNGANIAAALLLLRPEVLSDAILLRAMTPLSSAQPPDLTHKRVLMLSGVQDPVVPAPSADGLANLLRRGGAVVDHRMLPVGHALSNMDLTLASQVIKAAGSDADVPASSGCAASSTPV